LTHGHERRALGVRRHAALHLERAKLAGVAAVVALELGRRLRLALVGADRGWFAGHGITPVEKGPARRTPRARGRRARARTTAGRSGPPRSPAAAGGRGTTP